MRSSGGHHHGRGQERPRSSSLRQPRLAGGNDDDGRDPPLGPYIIIHSGTVVAASVERGGRGITRLEYGDEVEVVDVRRSSSRLRARLRDPAGWISLRAFDSDHVYAKPSGDFAKSGGVSPRSTSTPASARSPAPRSNVRSPAAGSSASRSLGSDRGKQARSDRYDDAGSDKGKRIDRRPQVEKHPKVAGPGAVRRPGEKPKPKKGDSNRWNFNEQDGHVITVDVRNKVQAEEVDSKEEAIRIVKTHPEKYFGCFWVKEPYVGKAKVYPRECIFFGSGMEESTSHPEAFAAMKSEYCVLPAQCIVRADRYTDDLLSSFSHFKLSCKSPGRQQGLCDEPGLKLIGDVDPNDIRQGEIGDCWLLSAISSVAEFDGAVHKLFKENGNLDALPRDGFNIYKVRLWDLRAWQLVDVEVDERLIWDDEAGDVLGCKPSSDHELWPCILEKAIAAHCGGWDKIDGGQSTHAWRMMLGCKEVYTFQPNGSGKYECFGAFNPNDKKWEQLANSPHDGFAGLWPMKWPEIGGGGEIQQAFTEEEMFAKMCAWEDANFIMCAGTKSGSDKEMTAGIVDGHCYSILDCIDNAGGTDIDMIKMRNPWGKQEFDAGGWGDDGPNWKKNPKVKEACKPVKADDGIFWMCRTNFFKYFKVVYLCAHDMKAWIGED